MKKLELLAPAGNFESFKMAINNGADAVYLGLDDFNARGNIENFSINNIEDVVSYAHLFNVKVYITLNTLINDDEFEKVYELVKKALIANVDAFIVQDLGLAYFLKQKFPNIELHASTQMGIENLEGALFAQKVGFKRIVLARETPLSEIKRIKDNCNIEIEYFIQGALCVAYSGNCYLCSLLANSSGNRGKCKQFCRLPYRLEQKGIQKEGYLLSTKDFCMIPMIKELAQAGVCSFKIEGRARRPAYVAQTVKTYRKILDNNFNYGQEDIIDIKKVFNRGDFIEGYFKNQSIIYSKVQNHIGILIGEILKINKGKKFNVIFIKSNFELHNGDVVKFFNNDKEVGIVTINDLKKVKDNVYSITSTADLKENWKVRLIVDSENEKKLMQTVKKLKINANFSAKPENKAILRLCYKNIVVSVESEFKVQKALSKPITEEDCLTQISKLGDLFEIDNFYCDIDNVFIAKSQLNEIRREAVEKLRQKIVEEYEKIHKLNEKKVEQKLLIKLNDFENLKTKKIIIFNNFNKFNLIKDKYNYYVFQPNEFDFNNICKEYEKYFNYNIFISFPIMTNEYEINFIKKIINACPNWGIYANNYYALELANKDKIIIGNNMNVYNSYTVKYYSMLGYKNIVLSVENIDWSKIKNDGANLFMFTSFYPEYMYFRHCPFKEHLKSKCNNCYYDENLKYHLNNIEFKIERRKIQTCQFILKSKDKVNRNFIKNINTIEEI